MTLVLLTVLAACSSERNAADVRDDTTASCVQGEDWPVFDGGLEAGEGQIAATSGDIDIDGQPDEVALFTEAVGTENLAWVRVEFGSGGVATGRWSGESFVPVPDIEIRVAELSSVASEVAANEIIIQVGEATADAGWSVVALEGCSVVTTTLDGEAFIFGRGRSNGVATIAGCFAVSRDEGTVQLRVNKREFAASQWIQEDYQLGGTTWTLLDSQLFSDFPVGDGSILFPVSPTLDSCQPLQR